MLRQEIQETRETVAARDAEVGELKTRVAELEKIQQQQQQLIAMKDSALAEARANLAKAQQQALQAPPPAKAAAGRDTVLWPWLALALLVVAVGGWWWWKRRGGEGRARPFAFPRKAGPMGPAARVEPAPAVAVPSFVPPPSAPPAAPAATPAQSRAVEPVAPTPVAPMPVAPTPVELAPKTAPEAAPSSPTPSPSHWTAAPDLVGTMPPASPAPVQPDENASPARKVELARAYLDLGDESAARELLREVMEGRDPVAREIAARMLREID
jgi:pilus assembly protein FimV